MKRRLRTKVWWLLINREVEKYVELCRDCLLVAQPDKLPPMLRYKFPEGLRFNGSFSHQGNDASNRLPFAIPRF